MNTMNHSQHLARGPDRAGGRRRTVRAPDVSPRTRRGPYVSRCRRGSRVCGAALGLLLAQAGCDGSTGPTGPCTVLFGAPNANTGLTEEQCRPECNCDGVAHPRQRYTEDEIAALAARKRIDPPAPLASDPYAEPSLHPELPDKVCGLMPEPGGQGDYRLATYDDAEAAKQAGATVTHHGACGLCSSLENLAVYIGVSDLTTPVRACALKGFFGPPEVTIDCLRDIGFDLPCAQIWYYNTRNTREQCQKLCIAALNEPYHQQDGSANPCIQCDEDKSGPVFRAVAGRTRRNSGLPTALCRPCDTVAPVTHRYP